MVDLRKVPRVAVLFLAIALSASGAFAKKKLVDKDPELDKITKVPPVGKTKKSKAPKKSPKKKIAKPVVKGKADDFTMPIEEEPISDKPVGGPGSPLAIQDMGGKKKKDGASTGSLTPPLP